MIRLPRRNPLVTSESSGGEVMPTLTEPPQPRRKTKRVKAEPERTYSGDSKITPHSSHPRSHGWFLIQQNKAVHGKIEISIKRRRKMPEETATLNAEETANIASFEENELAGMGKGEEQQEGK